MPPKQTVIVLVQMTEFIILHTGCRSVFLTIWHCILSAEALLQTVFWRFCPLERRFVVNNALIKLFQLVICNA